MESSKHIYALLILSEKTGSPRVMVKLGENPIKKRLTSLLQGNRNREAFELLKSQAEVDSYLPAGAKLSRIPQLTLIEDLL